MLTLPSPFYDDYAKIIEQCPQFTIPDTVTIVGAGAFGGWVGLFAAIAGVRRLVLVNPGSEKGNDRHDIQEREIAVGPYRFSDLHRPKVRALAEIIAPLRPRAVIEPHIHLFDPTSDDSTRLLEGLVFAGVSHTDVNRAIFRLAASKGLRCFSGGYAGVKVASISELPTQETIGGNEIPVWVGSAALSALLAIHAAFISPINYVGALQELLLSKTDFELRMAGGVLSK